MKVLSETRILDRALDAAEHHLITMLGYDSPEGVAQQFASHVNTHLRDEMTNIKAHGHRNEEVRDKPPMSTEAILLKALRGVIHHNSGLKPKFQLSASLMREVTEAISKAEVR